MSDFDDDFEGDGFEDGEPFDDHPMTEQEPDGFLVPDWESIAFFGGLAEEIAEERQRRDRLKQQMSNDSK